MFGLPPYNPPVSPEGPRAQTARICQSCGRAMGNGPADSVVVWYADETSPTLRRIDVHPACGAMRGDKDWGKWS